MPTVPIAILTLAFLGLNGLLWSQRPTPTLWLLSALVLGAGWAVVFLRLITRNDAGSAE